MADRVGAFRAALGRHELSNPRPPLFMARICAHAERHHRGGRMLIAPARCARQLARCGRSLGCAGGVALQELELYPLEGLG